MYCLPYEVPSRRGRGRCWTRARWRYRQGIGSWQALCPQARRRFLSRGTNSTLLLGENSGIGEERKSTTAGKLATAGPYQPKQGRQQHQNQNNIRAPLTAGSKNNRKAKQSRDAMQRQLVLGRKDVSCRDTSIIAGTSATSNNPAMGKSLATASTQATARAL
jgi:hypothetical protein